MLRWIELNEIVDGSQMPPQTNKIVVSVPNIDIIRPTSSIGSYVMIGRTEIWVKENKDEVMDRVSGYYPVEV